MEKNPHVMTISFSGINFREHVNNFISAVENNEYQKMSYSIWRQFYSKVLKMSKNITVYMRINYPTDGDIDFYTIDEYNDMIFLCPRTLNKNDSSFGSFIWNKLNEIENDDVEKENNNMNFNFDFGPIKDSNIRMSPYGLAIKNAAGTYVAYDFKNNSVMDVDVFNFDASKLLYKMPVALKDIAVGDVIIHNCKPMIIKNIADDGVMGAIDVYNGEAKGVMLTKNMFGFNFAIKVVSLINFNSVSEDNPFGNMWPLFMMDDDIDPMMLMFMMNSNDSENIMNNPMMMYLMMNKNNDNNILVPLMMMNMNK